jgi:hypothetical protein
MRVPALSVRSRGTPILAKGLRVGDGGLRGRHDARRYLLPRDQSGAWFRWDYRCRYDVNLPWGAPAEHR